MKTSIYSLPAFLGIFFTSTLFSFVVISNGQDIEWQQDLESAINKSKAEKKLVLMHFTASWCRPCQALEKFVFPNLEVVRSVNENVVPVKIDVDQDQTIVKEYGVTAIPFDIVITPGGRVIEKKKSPLDSNGYRRMMAGLSTPLKDLEDESKIAIAQKLNEFSNQFDFKPKQIAEFKSTSPEPPSHSTPTPSKQAAELARGSRVKNPFINEPISETMAAPTKVKNSFAVSAPIESQQPKPKGVSNDFAASKQVAINNFAFAGTDHRSESVKSTSVQLEPPVVLSEFEEITGQEQEQAFLMKQKAAPKLNPQVSPQMSFKSNAGPQLTQLMKQNEEVNVKPNASGFAANVRPKRVHQDRFFQPPQKPTPVGQTRVVEPSNSVNELLKPVHQIAKRGPSPQQLLAPNAPKVAPREFASTDQNGVAAKNVHDLLRPHQPQKQVDVANVKPRSMPAFGLRGKCPVTLLQEGKWVEGDAKFGCVHRDRVYIFADAEKLKAFRANPDFYSPILAGYDPVVFHNEGKLVDGLAEHGVFMGKAPDQRILLFRDAKTRDQFQQNPAAYMNSVRQAMRATSAGTSPIIR